MYWRIGVSKAGAYPASEFRLTKADGTTDAYWTKLWEAYDKRTDYVKGRLITSYDFHLFIHQSCIIQLKASMIYSYEKGDWG